MATSRTNIGSKFQNGDIPSNSDFEEIFDSFVHKDEDKADFQMVETGTDNQHYVTPALLRTGLQNIGIITGNSYMPIKEHFDSFSGTTLPLEKMPIKFSVKAFKNGQLLLEGEDLGQDCDYTINYNTATITFSGNVDNRNIEVDYWYKNLSPNPGGGGSNEQIDFTSFLHTSGNETKNGILTFNNTTPTSTSGVVLTNSGTNTASKVLDVTVSGLGNGITIQNTAAGTGVKVSNSGAGVGAYLNSTAAATGDILQVAKDGVVKVKIEDDGIITAPKYVTSGGTASQFVKGDGSLDSTVYANDTLVIHTTGNESKDGALTLTHDGSQQDVLTITKNNSANCLKLVQNSSSSATTSTFDTTTANVNRKAISVQKLGQEKAFITHEGNVTGTSFTTLNEKADITDGFLTLGGSASPTASSGHAKLYAKTDGTTDMYVMGSDGVEKKIGGVVDLSGKENTIAPGTTAQYYRGDKTWQTLDKITIGLGNIDNTSDLNKPVSTAVQTALNTKQATLVSGTNIKTINGVSVLGSGDIAISAGATITGSANKLAKFNSIGNNVIDSNITDNGSLVTLSKPTTIDSGTNDNSGLTLSRISNSSQEVVITNGLGNAVSAVTDTTKSYVYSTDGAQIWKINITSGVKELLILSGITIPSSSNGNHICRDNVNNLYIASSDKIYKINTSNVVTLFATIPLYSTDIILGFDNNLYVLNTNGVITKVTLSGTVSNVANNIISTATTIAQDKNGNFYVSATNYKGVYKVTPQGASSLFFTPPREVVALLLKDSNTMYLFYNAGGGFVKNIYELNLSTATLTAYENVSAGISNKSFLDSNGNIYVQSYNQITKIKVSEKVLKTDSTGLIVKTTYLEDVQYLRASEVDTANLLTSNNIKTINGASLLGSGDIVTASVEPSQITITTTTSITTDTLDANSKKQIGKNVVIDNGANPINITVNGGIDFCASYLKHGYSPITFLQGAGRTLVLVDGNAALSGVAGSTATISSVGTKDYLRISNA